MLAMLEMLEKLRMIGEQLFFAVCNYYLILFLYYWYHRFLHCPESGILYKMHYIGHHKRDFPVRRLRALSYSSDGSGGWFKTGGELAFGIPAIILLSGVYYISSLQYFINFVIVLLGVVFVGESWHSSYHLTRNAISHPEGLMVHRYIINRPEFPMMQTLHDIHHARMNKNFGFLDMTMDKLFGTYTENIPNYLIILTKHKLVY